MIYKLLSITTTFEGSKKEHRYERSATTDQLTVFVY